MNRVLQFSISLSVVFSLLSGVFINFFSSSGSYFTYIPITILLFSSALMLVKLKYIENYSVVYLLFYFSIIVIFISSFNNSLNFDVFKTVIYFFVMIIIINFAKIYNISRTYSIVILLTVIFTADVFLAASQVVGIGADIVNVRMNTLMDKSFLNILYNVALPITLIRLVTEKKKRYILLLIFFLVSAIFILQIKTLLLSLGLSSLFILYNFNLVKLTKLNTLITILFTSIILIFNFAPKYLPEQIVVSANYMLGNSDQIQGEAAKYTGTNLLREAIIEHGLKLYKDHYLLGIGMGNYAETTKNLHIRIEVDNRMTDQLPEVTENGVLSLLVEGGTIYTILHFLIVFYIITRSVSNRNKISINGVVSINIFLALFISNFVQDNNNFVYWFFMAISINAIGPERLKIAEKKVKSWRTSIQFDSTLRGDL